MRTATDSGMRPKDSANQSAASTESLKCDSFLRCCLIPTSSTVCPKLMNSSLCLRSSFIFTYRNLYCSILTTFGNHTLSTFLNVHYEAVIVLRNSTKNLTEKNQTKKNKITDLHAANFILLEGYFSCSSSEFSF